MLYNNQMSNYIFNTANTGDVSEFHANYWIKKMSEIIKIVENGYNADALQLQVYSSAGWCSGSDCCLKKYYHRINITLGEVYDTPSPLGL